ncbi:hypothetical protein Mycch_5346 (plasmid) [Mycolicibacterium chubuense NBB4]|uniref:TrwC relaxase domain-containing protein n=1 Tax=Mycolicibacterium chubuense (strain NBB4) TaxID=710421 RepID=I4BRW7_MYCCN|nr:relaxase domain-containing protein [Mycolicibacterium chubuense]AFM20024.1 hypothetical protein Mycch_5346 [Mycolicibacterium chubuense NBB4]
MVMTLHKLTAGDGYLYLVRQVAAADRTQRSRSTLADYYSAKGESPGRWMGRGLAALSDTERHSGVLTVRQRPKRTARYFCRRRWMKLPVVGLAAAAVARSRDTRSMAPRPLSLRLDTSPDLTIISVIG